MKMKRYKKSIFYFLAIAGICMTLACSKDLDPEAGKVHRSDVISFTASLQADATAAPKVARSATSSYLGIAEEEWNLELRESSRPTRGLPVTELEGMDVGVYAYEYSGDTKVADVMSNYYYSFDNNEDLNPVDDPVLWSDIDDVNSLRIYTYAPMVTTSTSDFALSVVDNVPTITYVVPQDVTKQIDLLSTDTKEVSGDYNQNVFLTFNHILTGVRFKAGFECKVTSIKINNVNSKGVYSMGDSWDDQSLPVNYTLPIPSVGIDCSAGDMITTGVNTLMMIPQTLPSSAEVVMEYTEGGVAGVITASLKDFKWEAGKLITYTINKTITEDYVYFDLHAGNVTITPTSYEGYVYVNGVATRVYKEFPVGDQENYHYYVYQSTAANKNETGYAATLGVGAITRPVYSPVMVDDRFWSDYITNNTVVEDVIEMWDSKEGLTVDATPGADPTGLTGAVRKVGRSSTKNRIDVKGDAANPIICNMVIDNLYSSYQHASESRKTGGITFLPAMAGSSLNITMIGDSRFGAIHYFNNTSNTQLIIGGTGSITVADADFDKSRSPFNESKSIGVNTVGYSSNHWCAAIGADDSSQSALGIVINSGVVYAGTTAAENCTAIGGGGNGKASIIINGGSVTAVATTTGTAIGGGIGFHSAGGEGYVEVNGGNVYAYNFANEWNIPSAAIGGGGSSSSTGTLGTIKISGGYVYAQAAMGTAIGGGSSKTKDGGMAVVDISGGYIRAKSVSTSAFPAGCGIGGGTGGSDGGKIGGNAEVTISSLSGNKPIIRTGSIGGGKTNSATGHIGRAVIKVYDGDISAQFVMAAGSTEKSVFTMSGGSIGNSDVYDKEYEHIEHKGGAVYMENGTFTMTGGTIKNCVADEGGAVYIKGIESPEFIMKGGEILNNTSYTNGGAVYLEGGTVTLHGGNIKSNLAKDGNGGGVYIKAGDFYMPEDGTCNIYRNVALKTATDGGGSGGGIYVMSTTSDVNVHVLSGKIENNACDVNGGGICVDMATTSRTANVKIGKDGSSSVDNPSIASNTAVRYGGGLYAIGSNAKITINGGKIINNSVSNYIPNSDVTNEGGTVELIGGQVKHQVVTFNANAADATVEGQPTAIQRIVTTTNSSLVFPTTPIRNFYDFIGWNSRADGKGTNYVNGQVMNISEDITLYAQWQAQ